MFSIGIPAFKGQYFKECIESVLAQTYVDFELIIVNDCSPDSLASIVAEFKDDRIKYFENMTNTGALNIVDNWNNCLNHATGDYFILLGDDDKLIPTYLSEIIELISKFPDLNVYHCRSFIIDEKSTIVNITPNNPDYEDLYDFLLNCLSGRNQQFISDFVYRTSHLKQKSGFYKLPLAWGSDYLSAYIACGKHGIAHTNKTLLLYRIHSGNITATGNTDLKWQAYQMLNLEIKKLLELEPDNITDRLKRHLVLKTLNEKWLVERESIVRQLIGSNKVKGLLKVYRDKKKYGLNFLKITKIVFSQLTSKILK